MITTVKIPSIAGLGHVGFNKIYNFFLFFLIHRMDIFYELTFALLIFLSKYDFLQNILIH